MRRGTVRKRSWLFLALTVLTLGGLPVYVFAGESLVKDALQPYVASNWLAGAVAVVVGPQGVISHDAVGYADVAGKKSMAKDALFWIASMTKPFTSVAFMMLVDEGKVALDDPVSTYIPQMANLWVTASVTNDVMTLRRQVRPITLRQLLSHTSGLPFLTPILSADLTSQPLDQQVLSFTMNPLEFQPGEGYRYSNQGIDTVGRVIEIVSGMPYERFLQTRLFNPLGMRDTTFFPTSRQVKRLARPYGANKEKTTLVETALPLMKPPFDRPGRYPEPGGGLFSTGADLARFCQLLLNKGIFKGRRLLSEQAFAELIKVQTGQPDKKYGLGFSVNPDGDGAFGHGGAAATNMNVYPERGLALIWLVQVSGGYPGKGGQAQGAFNAAAFEIGSRDAALPQAVRLAPGEVARTPWTQGFDRFVTRQGNKLMDGDVEFRFMGANMPGLVVPYDFTLRLPERMTLPTPWESEDAMKTLARMGMTVVRTWNLPIRGPAEAPQPWHYVLAPGQFNEAAFTTIDHMLAMANKHGVRVMICLTAEAGDYLGGIGTYAAHRGKKRGEFWDDPQLREDYKATVRHVLTRVNTVTGVPYREDKAILAWQFGNEMYSAPTDWLSEMAAFMKHLDPNHLIAETRHHPAFAPQLIDPNIDLLTRHYYSDYKGSGDDWATAVKREVAQIQGQRPFFVGEFGPYIDGKVLTRDNVESKLKAFLDTCVETPGVSGALLWSMYFHHRDGGYYWHQIFTYPSVWSYHFPGFPSADAQDEIGILRAMRAAAYGIRGLPVPPLMPPEAPELLPFRDVPLFAWRGSAGASGYDIERATTTRGPWTVIAANVSDADVAYRPLFSDETAKAGETWCYRVTARNEAGCSPPSDPVGPVRIREICVVDEFQDLTRVAEHSADLALDNTFNARYAEYLFRAKGSTNAWVSYKVNSPREIRITAFFQPASGPVVDPIFETAGAQGPFATLPATGAVARAERVHIAPPHRGDDYRQTQVDYTIAPPLGTRRFKLIWQAPMALDRVEISQSEK